MSNKHTLDFQDYQSMVGKICRDINVSNWKPDIIVGIVRGGMLPAVMISHYFNKPMETIKISLRDYEECESNLWLAEMAYGYESHLENNTTSSSNSDSRSNIELRKNILIVDDINDSGATINWLTEDWPSGCMPNDPVWQTDIWNNNVKFAVLVDNLSSNSKIKMDYIGMEVNKAENDIWLDFPWEDWWAK